MRRNGCLQKEQTLRYGVSFPSSRVIQGAYVDDLIIAGLVPQGRAACLPVHSSECLHCRDDGGNLPDVVTLQRALDSYKLAGAEMAEG